ncbi:MAG TPA: MarR family transcriptional regulator [Acidimicrobiales bacterium]|nr:MarR family transcriptional regulator [Acidimicrobiales bacterium]
MGPSSTSKAAIAADVWRQLFDYFQRHRERVHEHLQELGLSFGDMRALLVLDADDPKPMRVLADSWACDASNATWMVDRLEQRGLVERHPLPSDRRVKAVVLTPAGAKTKAELHERLAQPPPELLQLGRSDLEALRDALARLPPADGEPA